MSWPWCKGHKVQKGHIVDLLGGLPHFWWGLQKWQERGSQWELSYWGRRTYIEWWHKETWSLDDCLSWCPYLRGLRDHELVGNELFPVVMYVDRVVMYSAIGVPTTIPALRWGLFRLRNLEGKKPSCTRAIFMPIHISTLYFKGQKL